MPSVSLTQWQTGRLPSLREIDARCAASLAAVPPNPVLAEENVRGYVLRLSAHFQGFCRDLYTEAAQTVVRRVRKSFQVLAQQQFTSQLALDRGNPNLSNLRRDFERFGQPVDLSTDPANPPRLQRLAAMNEWRNIAAHYGPVPASGVPTLADLRGWRDACDGLAMSLDRIVYNLMRRILRRSPWPP
jgi:hypothetical protein